MDLPPLDFFSVLPRSRTEDERNAKAKPSFSFNLRSSLKTSTVMYETRLMKQAAQHLLALTVSGLASICMFTLAAMRSAVQFISVQMSAWKKPVRANNLSCDCLSPSFGNSHCGHSVHFCFARSLARLLGELAYIQQCVVRLYATQTL